MRYYSITVLTLCLLTSSLRGQVESRRSYFPIWSFHAERANINGISVGLWSLYYNSKPRFTHTNGIKYELIGIGIGIPLAPRSPVVETDSAFNLLKKNPFSEIVNGLNLSTSGTACHCLTNGLTAGIIGQLNSQVNGVSLSVFMNFTQCHNGVMMSLLNDAYYLKGLQLGFGNHGFKTRGIQIGLLGNNAKEMKGVQIGAFNRSENFSGLQIGLWNVNQKRKLPLLNWNFGSGKE